MEYLKDDESLDSLCKAFPDLLCERKNIIADLTVPIVDYHSGIFTKFSFRSGKFLNSHSNDCIRTCVVYAMFLLGNTPSENQYVVKYDKDTQNAEVVELKDLMYGAFSCEPVKGTFFKMAVGEL